MTLALSSALCALLTWALLTRVQGKTTSETSATQNPASNTSTAENSTRKLSDNSTSLTEISTTTLSQFSSTITTESSTTSLTTTTTSQTSTILPGPFLLTQSVVFLSDGTQEEVELLVLGALDLALAEATKIGYGPVVGLTRPAVVYEFVHDGHCAAGWINANIATDDVEAYALRCRKNPECAFFAWDTVSTTCAMYTGVHGCPDDNNFATFNAYRLVRVCTDGLSLTPVTPSECPSNPNIMGCPAARPGSLCEADHDECGSDDRLDNCGPFDVYRKEHISCIDDAQCPLQFRCSADSGVCVSDVTYGKLTAAAIAELEPPSADVEATSAFLEVLGDVLPELPAWFLAAAVFGDDPNLTAGVPAPAVWRIDLEVVASDVYSLEQVYEALGRLRDDDTWEHAAFLDVVQAIADNQSLIFDHFLFSSPQEGQLTNTTTATQTATIVTTASTSFEASSTTTATQAATIATTASTSFEASRTEPTSFEASRTEPTATTTTTATATATTTAALTTAEASRQPAARVENSTALIVGVAGGALVLLAALSGVAVSVLRRRKAVDAFQHNEPDCREPECKDQEDEEPEGNEWDVERAAAAASSSDSGNIQI